MIRCVSNSSDSSSDLLAYELLNKLYEAATSDHDLAVLEDLLITANFFWVCPSDGFTMWYDEDECACCGKPKP